MTIVRSQLVELNLRHKDRSKFLLRGGELPKEQDAPGFQSVISLSCTPSYTLRLSSCWDINYHQAEVRGAINMSFLISKEPAQARTWRLSLPTRLSENRAPLAGGQVQ